MKRFCTLLFTTLSTAACIAQSAVINEFSPDPTMWDGTGGEFIELYCPSGGGDCDISCWVVSDGQGLITIPTGTTIPAGGYYLIAYAPALNCATCDFFDVTVDLDLSACGCLSGGSYASSFDGNSTVVLGRSGNSGELVLLYDNNNNLIDSWKFDNASQAYLPSGGDIMAGVSNNCPATTIHIPDPANPFVVDVGAAQLGCNTSYTRSTDGGGVWAIDNHPTPRATNAMRGDNAFDYYYRLDGGAWQLLPKIGATNTKTAAMTICTGNTIQFRTTVRNYQNVATTLYDPSGKINSYFESVQTGRIAWASVQGLGNGENELLHLFSDVVIIPDGVSTYTLQWSDYKEDMGSTSPTSSNECYERLVFNLTRSQTVVSAEVACTDASAGINRVTTTPANVPNLLYSLYDDVGDQSNLITSNTSGVFVLGNGDVPLVGYYVVVTGPCNLGVSQVVATNLSGSLCRGNAPCPEITSSSFLQNGGICGLVTEDIYAESFEGASGVGYTVLGAFSDGADDYFDLINDGVNPTGVPAYTGADGNQFWAGEDIDEVENPNSPNPSSVTISGVNISGYSNVTVSGLFASLTAAVYDITESFRILARVDGGSFVPIGAFESTGTNTFLSQDANLDGTGDGLVFLGPAFQNFTFSVPSTGTTLDVRIEILSSAANEAMAFDNIIVRGDVVHQCVVCAGDVLTFSVTGDNLPGGGTIDWYSSSNAAFDPYAGQGDLLGSVVIPNTAACPSASLVLNEIMYRPALSNGVDPNTGEYIELLGPAGANIGCTVLTDGDWTITIPAGTTIPADGIFTIGNDLVYGGGTFDLDAENCGCFTESTGGNSLLILTDVGEYVALFNSTGVFQQGVVFGTPAAGNTPPDGALVTAGVINTVGLAGCPASVTIPGVASFETASGAAAVNESIIRNPDATGAWALQAGGSVNACNAVTPAPVPDFNYTVSFDDCNSQLYFKGIINPHPNTVSCPNTATSAATTEFDVEVSCPTATLTTPDQTLCSNALPVTLSVVTTGIADGTNVTINYTQDGAAQTAAATVNANATSFAVNQTGTYSLQSLTIASGCDAQGSGSTDVVVVGVPNAPNTPATVSACVGTTATLSASGAGSFQWSFMSDFSIIAGTGADFTTTVPTTVYVRGFNQDDALSVTCIGSSATVNVLDANCPDITYPIKLLSFYGYPLEDDVVLRWFTASEENNDYFDVERSTNGLHFISLGKVKGAGTTTEQQSYQFVDAQPVRGWNYYRLRQVDFDKSESLTHVVAVQFDEDELPICAVYPNPIDKKMHIRWQNPVIANTYLSVYNQLGQRIEHVLVPEDVLEYELPAHRWAAGIYQVYMHNRVFGKAFKVVKE